MSNYISPWSIWSLFLNCTWIRKFFNVYYIEMRRHKFKRRIITKKIISLFFFSPVSSNDEVYDKMRRQRMLREELRQKKREVEAIMKKDSSRKSYGKNQDAQSDTVSFSTDAFG